MKLTGLRALVAAIEEGSLRAAARRIGVSQPALTRLIRDLEAELSATLLQRSTGGVVPTPQGMVLYQRALAADRELKQAVEQIRQLGGRMTGQLTIGAVPLAVMLLMPECLRTFSRAFPDIQLRIVEELYLGQLTGLRRGEFDISLGPLPGQLPVGEFIVEELMPIEMVVVVRRGNPLARARSLQDLADAPWIYTGVNAESGYARPLFEQHGLTPPRAAALVNSTLGLVAVLAAGDYVGLFPRQIVEHRTMTEYFETVAVDEGPLSLTLAALVRSGTHLKPAVRQFLAHLHRAAHQLGRTQSRGPIVTSTAL